MKVDMRIAMRFNIIYIMRLLSISWEISPNTPPAYIALLYYCTKTVAYGSFLNYFSNIP